ncbi:MAG: amidase [Candidatus Eisenbacteria bacterium]|uniref:Amidase n=1 Tax=Eiseniibacteriota bacterium TaxID=2212470 RepID=A0A538TYA1_UNCEI|nr:MAG: amidase [Candidatus Eisenbacteria bacterium]
MSAAFLSAVELARAYARRDLSPVEVTRELLARIERLDPELRAFVALMPERALAEAQAAEAAIGRGEAPGPLCGVPVGIKDLIDVAGLPCAAGSRILKDRMPASDAFVVERLTAQGVVFLGKQNLHEFAYGITTTNDHFGTCRNPWDRSRVPGGSSGGSGAALAAGLCVAAIGTDSGGSIRIPSAACGVVGLKPTLGRVSRRGVFPLAWSLDHVGPMTRTVADAALVLEAIAATDPSDPWCASAPALESLEKIESSVRGLRFGVPGTPFEDDLEPAVAAAVEDAIGVLAGLGARRVTIDARPLRDAYTAFHAVLATEASAIHERWMRERRNEYGPLTRQALARGFFVSGVEYVNARREQSRVRGALDAMLETVDVLVTPTLPRTAPAVGAPMSREPAEAWNRLVVPFSLAGLPALTVPCGFDPGGLPIGLQIAGRAFDEASVLRVGAAYERATEWHRRHPPDVD